jgi:alpha-methylacyl-CoA racemase
MSSQAHHGPLAGLRIVELAGIGPCPFAGMLLADLGADVLRIDRDSAVPSTFAAEPAFDVLQRQKRSVGLDLKSPAAIELVLGLLKRADAFIEGFRPGVTERLGLGPDECLAVNPRLVYGRMTGWGQSGPLSSHPGHDIDYIAIAGVLGTIGRQGEPPLAPLNLVGDFGGGGMLLGLGVLAALLEVARGGNGQVVDAAMVDGAALMMAMTWGFSAMGVWTEQRGSNLLDSGAPYYETYECADGGYVAVGALEPQFYAALCRVIDLDPDDLPPQMDRSAWPATKERFATIFRQHSRDEWVQRAAAEDGDACLAPVLSMTEAAAHPHNVARGTFTSLNGVVQPAPAPRFSASPTALEGSLCRPGEGGLQALEEWGIETEAVTNAARAGILKAF